MSFDRRPLALLLALGLLAGAGCSAQTSSSDTTPENGTAGTSSTDSTVIVPDRLDLSDLFTDRDLDDSYDAASATAITLADGASQCDSSSVTISGDTVTITGEGVYLLTGTLSDGQIIVDAGKKDKVQLVCSGASIACTGSAPLYVKQADKVFLTLDAGTENALTATGDFVQSDDNNVDGAIFSKDDLTINGSGSLTVTAESGHGIVSKDDLAITGGTLAVTAANHALSGKDSVRIGGGTLTLTAGKDGVHSENDDSDKGWVCITDGTLTITSDGDGIDASGLVQIAGGGLTLTTGGGSANAATKSEEFFGKGGFGGGRGMQFSSDTDSTEDTTSTASCKGVKSDVIVYLDGGTLVADSADDTVHSNGVVEVTAGTLTLSSGDDGIHADDALTISEGTIDILTSYEGLEGKTVTIDGGLISLVASDDGVNAAGGNDSSGMGGPMGGFDIFSSESGVSININGGTLTVNASGDGIDSNGDLTVTGGEIYVFGPLDSGNGAIDHNGTALISGGTLVALSCSSMEETFDESSTQGTISLSLSATTTGDLTLTDSTGTALLGCVPAKQYSVVQLSCPGLTEGSTYTLTTGTETTTIQMDSLHYGTLSGMGGGMGNMGGGGMGNKGGMGSNMGGGKMGDNDGQSSDQDGTAPELPDGQTPDQDGTMPQMPDGQAPDQDGTMPQMPDGQTPDQDGTMPQMPDGQTSDQDGTTPQMPNGQSGGSLPASQG
jgi:hypothetical protein